MNKKILAKEELIGHHVTIQECTDPSWINKSGTIVDETKNTAVFRFEDYEKTMLEGKKLTYRPEDRIKKAR